MLGITSKRLLILVFLGCLLYVALQYVPLFFYALEFDDFVRDEVKFAPLRETDDKEHIMQHILDEARFYRMILDKNDIKVTKTRDSSRGINFLTADVEYRMPVDLYYFTHEVRFHLHTSTAY
jgi:hypothetical protein